MTKDPKILGILGMLLTHGHTFLDKYKLQIYPEKDPSEHKDTYTQTIT